MFYTINEGGKEKTFDPNCIVSISRTGIEPKNWMPDQWNLFTSNDRIPWFIRFWRCYIDFDVITSGGSILSRFKGMDNVKPFYRIIFKGFLFVDMFVVLDYFLFDQLTLMESVKTEFFVIIIFPLLKANEANL